VSWYARPVLGVSDAEASAAFYIDQLGFNRDWDYAEEGRARIVQVSREGCELILSDQWQERVGQGRIFVSLDTGAIDGLRAELEGKGVAVEDGSWGYRLMIVHDPDGNALWFPYPAEAKA